MYDYVLEDMKVIYGMFFAIITVALIITLMRYIGLWKMFNKAGEKGWKVFVPFYNNFVAYELFWGNGWFSLLLFAPVLNMVISVLFAAKIAESFDRDLGCTLMCYFLPFIMFPILGFGADEYYPPEM